MGNIRNIKNTQMEMGKSSAAVITLDFSRLWDLMSIHQRQYALHLSNPTRFPSQYAADNDYPFCAWAGLSPAMRIGILDQIVTLPGVHSITWSRH